jgi:hypothetical protein
MAGATVRPEAELDRSREALLRPSCLMPFRFLTPFGRVQTAATAGALEPSYRGCTITFAARQAEPRLGGLSGSSERRARILRTSERGPSRERRVTAGRRRHRSARGHRLPDGLRGSREGRSRLEAQDVPGLRVFDCAWLSLPHTLKHQFRAAAGRQAAAASSCRLSAIPFRSSLKEATNFSIPSRSSVATTSS